MDLIGDQHQPDQHDDGAAGTPRGFSGIDQFGQTDGDQDRRPVSPEEAHRDTEVVEQKEHTDSHDGEPEDQAGVDAAAIQFRRRLPVSAVALFHIRSP